MWKRTNLEDAHENSLVSSRIRCLKTRVRFVDKILFFPVQLQLFKEKQQRILTNIQGLPTHTYVCTDFTYQNQHVLNYYSCFWCLTSLPFFERKVDFCVFTWKKNIVELKKPKHEENNMIWKYIGEVLLPLKCSSFFLLATLAARCKTPVVVNLGQFWVVKKHGFGSIFFRSTFLEKVVQPLENHSTLFCCPWIVCVPLPALAKLGVSTKKEDGWDKPTRLVGLLDDFFGRWNSLLVENPKKIRCSTDSVRKAS